MRHSMDAHRPLSIRYAGAPEDASAPPLTRVSVSFRNCLPCERTIEALRSMARACGAVELVALIESTTSRYELSAFLDDGAGKHLWRAQSDTLAGALERLQGQLGSWRFALGAQPSDQAETKHSQHSSGLFEKTPDLRAVRVRVPPGTVAAPRGSLRRFR